MKAILITKKGGPEVLELRDLPVPEPARGEVLIRVKAAGVNRSDIVSRTSAAYGKSGPEIPGLEVSGTVEAPGQDVLRWKKGDAVCALLNGGGYAEYVTVPEGQCLPLPENVSLEDSAGLPETIFTVWMNVFRTGALKQGQCLLVHGGSSGIGATAIQLAKAFGASCYVTAGSDEKCRWCESLGAVKAVNYRRDDFERAFEGIGMDLILDMTGGDFTPKNIRLLKDQGMMIYIAALRGREATIEIGEIMRKRITITGSMLKPRDPAFKATLAAEVEEKIWPLVKSGAFKTTTCKVFPLAEAAAAQTFMEGSGHMGKILLRVN
jgi:putative PIG3 family NAD(P)H quinone oxidoreductase